MPALIVIIALFWAGVFGLYKVFNPAQAATSQTLTLSGVVPEKGYTIQDGWLTVSEGYIVVVNDKPYASGSKVKLDDPPYNIIVLAK